MNRFPNSKRLTQISHSPTTLNQCPRFLIEMVKTYFSHRSLTINFPFLVNTVLIDPLLLQKHYRPSIIDAGFCCWSFPQVNWHYHCVICLCTLIFRHAGLHWLGAIDHYFLSCCRRCSGVFCLCIDDSAKKKKKKLGRLHSNTRSHPLPACCFEPILLCVRFKLGRSKKKEQRPHRVIQYWSKG